MVLFRDKIIQPAMFSKLRKATDAKQFSGVMLLRLLLALKILLTK